MQPYFVSREACSRKVEASKKGTESVPFFCGFIVEARG
jgi:hypothetical protein